MCNHFGVLLGLILFAGTLSCQNSNTAGESRPDLQYSEPGPSKLEMSEDAETPLPERKIIQTAEVRFQVDNLEESTERIRQLAEQHEGFIFSMNQYNSTYARENELTVRIPAEQLDTFLAEIEGESLFTDFKRLSSQDVTEEYIDITSRLATKKEVRDRYVEILRNRAGTVEEILNAEEKIRVLQEEIESIEGRLRYLDNRTSLSTVTINLYQKVAYQRPPETYHKPFGAKVKQGFLAGWNLLQQLFIGLITIWPIVLILGLIWVFRRRLKWWGKK